MEKIEQLWAQYGKLQAKREGLTMSIQEIINQMREITGQIAQLQKEPTTKKE